MSENLYAKEKSVLENNSAVELHPTSSDRVGWKIAQKLCWAVKQIALQILMRQYWLRLPLVSDPIHAMLSSTFCLCEPEEWV